MTLAQSWQGVEELIWAAINRQWKGSLMADLSWGKMLTTKLELGPDEFAVGASSDKPAKLEGKHGFSAMRVVDEAKEVDDAVFESTEGLLNAPESWDVWISTPSIPDGRFFRRDTGNDTSVIRAIVTVEDLIQDYKTFGYPTLAGMESWRDECKREWGEDDPRYRSRCMAEYVENIAGALFPVSWIERAFGLNFGDPMIDGRYQGEPMVGQDVAGSLEGDENAVASSQRLPDGRLQALGMKAWAERDTMVSKGRGHAFAMTFGNPTVAVDSIGLGKGVFDARCQEGLPTREYRASDKARDDWRYVNQKAEDCFLLRDDLEKGRVDLSRIPGALKQKLKSQMVGMRFEEMASGKVRVVDPADSPDLFDAFLISSSPNRVGMVGAPRMRGM